MRKRLFFLLLITTVPFSRAQTIGLISNSGNAAAGYTLFAPVESSTTFLIDNNGCLIHDWQSTNNPGLSVYLLDDGTLLRAETIPNQKFNGGGSGGRIKEISWEGETAWQFDYSSQDTRQHHDVEPMPNGNILIIAYEVKSGSEAVASGRMPILLKQNEMWPDQIVEVKPSGNTGGEIVWEWHAWDHIIQNYDKGKENYGVVAEHPELININFVQSGQNSAMADWLHINSVDYNAELDQIILSVRHFCEVWIIDHSTTTEEAAGHTGGRYGKGGDLLYRFGNPQAYDHGSDTDKILFYQHDAHWIPKGNPGAGNVLVFNNGSAGTDHNYSSVDEFIVPVNASGAYQTDGNGMFIAPTVNWSYTASNLSGFFAMNMSGAQRLSNGHTLICSGTNGTFFEIDSENTTLWKYVNPVTGSGSQPQGGIIGGGVHTKNNNVYRCTRYAPDYPAFDGKDLTPGSPIEIYASVDSDTDLPSDYSLVNYPNPFNPTTTIRFSIPKDEEVSVKIFNALGQEMATLANQFLTAGPYEYEWNANGFASGVYLVRVTTTHYAMLNKMLLLE
jgi:hypothetical protein